MRRAYVEIRQQPAKTGKSGWSGPNAYVAVQVVPDGQIPLQHLERRVAKNRGIQLVYFGEGYLEHQGPKSALGKALKEAWEYADSIEKDIIA